MIEAFSNRIERNNEIENVKKPAERTESFHDTEKAGQETAEKIHIEAKESILREHGEIMGVSQRERLENANTTEHIHVMESSEYVEKFTDVPFEVVGHCDKNGEIYIKNLSSESVKHITVHETMHLCSYRDVNMCFQDGYEIRRSGLRDFRETAGGEILSYNTGINEGLTEMYTLRELNGLGETEAVKSMNCYANERMWAERMETVLGSELVEKAYFGGEKKELINAFNRLNNNDVKAWDRFSENLDTLYKQGNQRDIERVNKELTNQYFTMIKNKYI